MPIRITVCNSSENCDRGRELAWLCDKIWYLPEQLAEFEKWLQSNQCLPKGIYSADIGFAPRPDAMGGGGGLSLVSIEILCSMGMEVWFSEYPAMVENNDKSHGSQ